MNFKTSQQRGFTLLEVLLVITIVGIIVGVVSLSFGSIDQRRLVSEADRLKLAFNQAADFALMQQETLGWFYDAETNQYWFKILDLEGGWVETDQKLFQQHHIEVPAEILVKEPSTENQRDLAELSSEFLSNKQKDNYAADEPNDDNKPYPSIVFLSSGEYTRFMLSFVYQDEEALSLEGNGFSNINYQRATEL